MGPVAVFTASSGIYGIHGPGQVLLSLMFTGVWAEEVRYVQAAVHMHPDSTGIMVLFLPLLLMWSILKMW